jgi:hypothetical protein
MGGLVQIHKRVGLVWVLAWSLSLFVLNQISFLVQCVRLIVYMCGWLHVLGYMRRLIDDMAQITVPEDIPHISHDCPYQSHHTNVVLVYPKQAGVCDIFSQRPLLWP